jgi:hypothetical protein
VGDRSRPAEALPDAWPQKGGMRRLAESGGTAHELMAISGHRTLSEVQRYTEEADRKKLADSGTKKRTENAGLANLGDPKWQTRG